MIRIRRFVALLAVAAAHVGHRAIRNRGTLGGSLAHADPAAELPAAVLALGATVIAAGPRGHRRIGVEDFFREVATSARSLTSPPADEPVPDRETIMKIMSRHGQTVLGPPLAGGADATVE